jgi:hypothetical protein
MMMERSKNRSKNTATGTKTRVDYSSNKRWKNICRKKLFPLIWKLKISKPTNNSLDGMDGLCKEQPSTDSDNDFSQPEHIDRIPTAIEYSSSISTGAPFDNEDCQSRYSVPMEIDQIEDKESTECDQYNEENDFIPDQYSILINEDDDDNLDDSTLGSLDNDSFISDTALRDEIQNEREQIKKSYMLTNKIGNVKKPPFDFTTCFGQTSIYNNLR